MDAVFLDDFRRTVDTAAARLLALSAEQTTMHPAPGKWSPKEVVGHLIDSASNNHGRFVRAQLQDDLRFDGYAQADWVEVQRYQERAWIDPRVLHARLRGAPEAPPGADSVKEASPEGPALRC